MNWPTGRFLQANRFGACFSTPAQVTALRFEETGALPRCSNSKAASNSMPGAFSSPPGAHTAGWTRRGASDSTGAGIYYAATQMEANLCGRSTVIVCGGGNSAGQAAMFLSAKGEEVLLVIRAADLHRSHEQLPFAPGRGQGQHRNPALHRGPAHGRVHASGMRRAGKHANRRDAAWSKRPPCSA